MQMADLLDHQVPQAYEAKARETNVRKDEEDATMKRNMTAYYGK
jgi:hypothetical protein